MGLQGVTEDYMRVQGVQLVEDQSRLGKELL